MKIRMLDRANLTKESGLASERAPEARHDTARAPRMPVTEPARLMPPSGSWGAFVAVACGACAVLCAAIWISTDLHPDPALHNAALFVHLASLVLGFGAVLVADYLIAVWLVGRSTFAEAVSGVDRLHLLVWTGLIGMVVSGALLEPNLATVLTRAKLVLVLLLTLNGLQAMILNKRMKASTDALSARLFAWGAVTTVVSQGCWWGAMWIGFWTATHRH